MDQVHGTRAAPWNIVLKDFLFRDFVSWPFLTITYPQFPLTATNDICDEVDESKEDESDENDESDDSDDENEESHYSAPPGDRHSSMSPDRLSVGYGSDYIMRNASSPRSSSDSSSPPQQRTMYPVVRESSHMSRQAAPSPESSPHSSPSQRRTMHPIVQGPSHMARQAAPSPESLPHSSPPSQQRTMHPSGSTLRHPTAGPKSSRYSSPTSQHPPIAWDFGQVERQDAPSPDSYTVPPDQPRMKKRSTRIPDFAELLFEIQPGIDRSVLGSVLCRNRVILIVEVKKDYPNFNPFDLLDILPLTYQQAPHAFKSFPQVLKLGVIVAVGDKWLYREYDRRLMERRPSKSQQRDLTYQPSPSQSPVPSSLAQTYDPVECCFGQLGYGCLQEPSSNMAFREVRKRLLDICQMTAQT